MYDEKSVQSKKGPAGMHFHTSDRASFPLYSLLSFCFTFQISSVLNRIVIHPAQGIDQRHQPIKAAFLKSQKTGQCPLISTGGQRYTKIRFIKYDVAFHRFLFHKGAVNALFKMEQIRCFHLFFHKAFTFLFQLAPTHPVTENGDTVIKLSW